MNGLARSVASSRRGARRFAVFALSGLTLGVTIAGCGGSGSEGGTGGRPGSGGAQAGTGGTSAGTGGASIGTGGVTPGTGGAASGTGGAPTGSGGAASGGGGVPGTGGRTGGNGPGGNGSGSGGASGGGSAGRAATGGSPGTTGRAGTGGAGGSGTGAGGSVSGAGCGVADPLKSGRASITVSGTAREYILRLPDNYDASKPYKLIFAFHPSGGSASQIAGSSNNDYYGLYSRAAGSAIFVSPEGIDAGWRNSDGRDINFVKAMLALFNSKLCIDQKRIFSTGFSFGGMMSDAIGCAMSDVFRAIAPMAGGIPNAEHPYSGCMETNMHPVAVWMAHGTSDTVVPIADGKAALALFLKRAGCQSQTMATTPSPCVAYQGCMADYPIHFCEWQGGHGVPSFAAQGIWASFSQF